MAIFSRSFAVGGTAFNMLSGVEGMSRPRTASLTRTGSSSNAVRSVSRSPVGVRPSSGVPRSRDPSPFARSSRSGSRAPSLERDRERNRPPSAGSTGSGAGTGHQSRRAFQSKVFSIGSSAPPLPFARRTPSNSLERGNPRRITPSPTAAVALPGRRFDPVKYVREQEEKRTSSIQNKCVSAF